MSLVIHLLFLAAYSRMAEWYRLQDLRPTRYLPDLLLLAPDLFRQVPIGQIPKRLMKRVATSPDPGKSVPMPSFDGAPPAIASLEPLPPEEVLPELGERPMVFLSQPELQDFTLNDREIEAVQRLRDQYDAYARYWAPLADTSSAEGRARTKAEAIVARAFEAMGGLDKLLHITEMRMVVWVIAIEHVLRVGRTEIFNDLPPYPYPIAFWRMHGLDGFEQDAFRVEYDLTSSAPFPSYVTKNPIYTRQAYYSNFDARWHIFAPSTTRKLRLKSERDRWHFCDWFLGEGIRLSYVEVGRLETAVKKTRVHQIRVDDRKYGRLYDAFFDFDSGLLVAMRERLSEAEARWFQQKNNREAPTWVTRYEDYRMVEDVLLPHRWLRTASSWVKSRARMPLNRVDLRFNIAINGANPDTLAPEL